MNLLFLCTGNSCRSQMAEGWARQIAASRYPQQDISVSSAGLEAHGLNPRAVKAMKEQGIDISKQTSDILDDAMIAAADIVISVCSHADANCPILPAQVERIHMPFEDPAGVQGTETEIEACFEKVCIEIGNSIETLFTGRIASSR